MNDEFTEQDKTQAAAALVAWFRSQNISKEDSVDVMIDLIAFALTTGTNDQAVLRRRLAKAQTALARSTQKYEQTLLKKPIKKPSRPR